MTETVVNLLEIIQIDERHTERTTQFLRLSDEYVGFLLDKSPVITFGQIIMPGQISILIITSAEQDAQ